MKRDYIIRKSSNSRLVIFFTGWSTNHLILSGIDIPEGYDLLCCYEYNKIEWKNPEKEYKEVIIIAWSLGVKVVELLYDQILESFPVTGLYAINGTGRPVDDLRGIPQSIFHTTLENLDERNLKKFRIRISGGVSNFNLIKEKLSTDSTIPELKNELKEIEKYNDISTPSIWDYAFLSEKDMIFPFENLKTYWNSTPYKILQDAPHIVNFQEICNLIIKNKDRIGDNFKKNEESYKESAIVQKKIADRLIKICKEEKVSSRKILEIGSGAGILTDKIISCLKPDELFTIDLSEREPKDNEIFIKGDAETEISKLGKEKFNLVLSGSTFQWFHSPLKIMKEIRNVLDKKGKLIFSVFTEGTFKEIKSLTGFSLLYLTDADWLNLSLKAGYKLVREEKNEDNLLFPEFIDLLRHIRKTGVNSLSHKSLSIGEIRNMASLFSKENGNFKLTYKSLTLILEKV